MGNAISNIKQKRITPEQIKEIIMSTLKVGDKIHITKKSRNPINNALATIVGVYNHFISIEAYVNKTCCLNFTISYSNLFTEDTIIHEITDKITDIELELNSEEAI